MEGARDVLRRDVCGVNASRDAYPLGAGDFAFTQLMPALFSPRATVVARSALVSLIARPSLPSKESEPRIHWFTLQREHAKDALVHPPKRLSTHEPLERFDPERKFAHGE